MKKVEIQQASRGRAGPVQSPTESMRPSYVSTQLCTLFVGDVGGQRVNDVQQQLLAQ